MVELRFIRFNDDWVEYEYIPEGKEELVGIVAINKKTLERKILRESKETFSNYKFKAFLKMKEFVEENEFPKKYTVAWY